MKAEARIKGAELLEAIDLFRPISSQTGTRIIAPPMPSMPPTKPPAKPSIIALFKKLEDILSY
jgi:hypothetical protein